MEVARQYEVEKNTAQAEVNRLRRRLVDVTNDDNGFTPTPKRRRTYRQPLHDDLDEDNGAVTLNHTRESFVYQVGHKYFLQHAPWVHSGEDIFEADVDESYNPAERFENDENKVQGQLREILGLLLPKFEERDLSQRWVRRQVSFTYKIVLYVYI